MTDIQGKIVAVMAAAVILSALVFCAYSTITDTKKQQIEQMECQRDGGEYINTRSIRGCLINGYIIND